MATKRGAEIPANLLAAKQTIEEVDERAAEAEGSWAAGIALEADTAWAAGIAALAHAPTARWHLRHAVELYEQLTQTQAWTTDRAYKKALAHRLLGQRGQAIATLLQAESAAPWNRQVRQALALARAEVRYPAVPELIAACQPVEQFRLSRYLSPWQWWGLCTTVWLGGWLAMAWYVVSRRWLLLAVLLMALAASGVAIEYAERRWLAIEWLRKPPVVLARDSWMHTGNAAAYPLRWPVPLPEGTEGRYLTTRGGWVLMELADGSRGWVEAGAVIIVYPMAANAPPLACGDGE